MGKNQQTELFSSGLRSVDRQLSDHQKLCWLRLIRTPNIGPITFRDLVNHFGSADGALSALENGGVRGKSFKVIPKEAALLEIEQATNYGARLVARGEAGYPRWLQVTDGAPPLLYIKGDAELASRNIVAIVGSRNASAAGRKFAAILGRDLGRHGFIIVSGLARGIDREAHLASLDTGTIAVLGGGIDHVYPSQNEELYNDIGRRGLLVSERAMSYSAKGKDFPRRNRIISGMAIGTIIIEAANRSGSLTTARFAGEQGRDVFGVPGNPLDPRAAGVNRLIQDGAMLVSSAQDIIDFYSSDTREPDQLLSVDAPSSYGEAPLKDAVSEDEVIPREMIVNLLGPTPIQRDELCRQANCSARYMQIVLLELDLEGRLEHHGAQAVSLRPG